MKRELTNHIRDIYTNSIMEFYQEQEKMCEIAVLEFIGSDYKNKLDEVKQLNMVQTPDGAVRICKDGAVVSNIIHPPKMLTDF